MLSPFASMYGYNQLRKPLIFSFVFQRLPRKKKVGRAKQNKKLAHWYSEPLSSLPETVIATGSSCAWDCFYKEDFFGSASISNNQCISTNPSKTSQSNFCKDLSQEVRRKLQILPAFQLSLGQSNKQIRRFLKYIFIESILQPMPVQKGAGFCLQSLPCRWQQHSRLEIFFHVLLALVQSIFLLEAFVEEKRFKLQRQISLCPHISLKHYFKVELKQFP